MLTGDAGHPQDAGTARNKALPTAFGNIAHPAQSPAKSTAEFLRRQADNCLRIARTCFDLASAERMRLLATELRAKAAEIESDEHVSPSAMGRNHPYSDRNNNRQ